MARYLFLALAFSSPVCVQAFSSTGVPPPTPLQNRVNFLAPVVSTPTTSRFTAGQGVEVVTESGGAEFIVDRSPVTQEILARVPCSSPAEIEHKIQLSKQAQVAQNFFREISRWRNGWRCYASSPAIVHTDIPIPRSPTPAYAASPGPLPGIHDDIQ